MSGPYWYINLAEAALWIALGAGTLALAILRRRISPRLFLLAVLLIAFGLSDVVETRTGAWWRPWWLLAWKSVCVAGLLAFAAGAIHQQR